MKFILWTGKIRGGYRYALGISPSISKLYQLHIESNCILKVNRWIICNVWFQLIEEIACETLFNVTLYHPRVQSKIKPLKLELNQSGSNHIQPANQNHQSSFYLHHTKKESQNESYHQFYGINRLFQNPMDWRGQTLDENSAHQRNSTYDYHHLPTNSRDTESLRLVTPGSTSSTSSFESRDEPSERPSVIVKLEK